jgi:hypothetical protein
MENLAEKYPKITDALHASILEKFVTEIDEYGCADENSISEVSARSYDGFIAHTNGGFRTLVSNDLGSVESEMSEFETACLQRYIDSSHNDAATDWLAEDEREELRLEFDESDSESAYAWLNDRWYNAEIEFDNRAAMQADMIGDTGKFWQTDMAGEREAFWEYDRDYLSEGGTFYYELTALFYEKNHRRNVTGEDELFIFAGINTDFTYGRERGLETVWENTYKVERLTPARLEVIVEHCQSQISSDWSADK